MAVVRREAPEDADAVRLVNERAFGRGSEVDLVDALRRRDETLKRSRSRRTILP